MTTHTPAPWKISGKYLDDIRGPEGHLIAAVTPHVGNSRLIAAAPELLEALRGMCELAERLTNKRVQPDHSPAYRLAQEAIAKATQP